MRDLMGRKNSDWQISCVRDVQVVFFKDNGTFVVFFLLNILCEVYLFITINKKVMPFLAF